MTTPIATAYVDILPTSANFAPQLRRQIDEALSGVKAKAKETGNAIADGVGGGAKRAERDMAHMGGVGAEAMGKIKEAVAALVAFEGLKKLSEAFLGAGEAMEHLADRIIVGTGASGAKLEELVGTAKSIALEVPNSFNDIGTAVTQVAQRLDLTGEPLKRMATAFLDISRITGEQLSIPETTKALAAFGVKAKDQAGVLEQLFAASQRTGVTMSNLVAGLATGAPVLTRFGFSAARSADLLANLDKAGVSADKTTVGLRLAFSKFAKAGLDPQKALVAVVGQMQAFIKAGNEPKAGAIAGKIFGTRGAAAFTAAVASGALSVETLSAAAGKVGTPIEDAAAKTLHFGEQMAILKHQISEAVGDKATHVLEFLTAKVEELRVKLASPEFRKFGTEIADAASAIGAAIGPVIDAMGTLAGWLVAIAGTGAGRELLKVATAIALIAAAGKAVVVLRGVGLALAGIGVGGGAVGVAALGLAAKNLAKIGLAVAAVDLLNKLANKATGSSGGLATRMGEGFKDLKGIAGDAFDGIVNGAQGAADGVSAALNAIPGVHIDTSEFDRNMDAASAHVIGLHETLNGLPAQVRTDYTLSINTIFTSGGQHEPGSAASLANEFTAEKTGALGAARAKAAAGKAVSNVKDVAAQSAADIAAIIKKISSAGSGSGGGGGGGGAAASAAKSAAKAAASALAAAGKQISGRTFVEAITGTPEKIQSAFDKLLASLKAGNRGALAAYAKGIEHDLLGQGRSRDALSTALDTAKTKLKDLRKTAADFAETVRTAITTPGSVAEGSAGIGTTFTGIRNNLRAAIASAQAFAAAIATLTRLKLNDASLRQIVEAGPEAGLAQAQALARSGAGGVGQINTLQADLTARGKTLGDSVSATFYAAGISVADGLVKGLKSQEAALDAAMTRLADRMVKHLKDALGIHSPSAVFFRAGVQIPAGLAGGVRAGTHAATAAAGAMSQQIVFGAGAVQVHGVSDPDRARTVGGILGHGVADVLSRNRALAALAGG